MIRGAVIRNMGEKMGETPPHYGLTGRIIKNLKLPKKLRQGAQNSGKITSNLELMKLFAIHSKYFFLKVITITYLRKALLSVLIINVVAY